MKKVKESKKVRFDKTELTKLIIYKVEDNDDVSVPPMFPPKYFTLKALRFYVIETLWDNWEDVMGDNEEQGFTKMEIIENDECLFAYLDSWNYKVTRITYQDLK
jgi:hypothetical protein